MEHFLLILFLIAIIVIEGIGTWEKNKKDGDNKQMDTF